MTEPAHPLPPHREPPKTGTRGRLIYDARQALRFSQAEAARRIGASTRQWKRWEHNQSRPGLDFSEAIAELLNLPVEKVLDPAVAHIRRNQDKRVAKLLTEVAVLRTELAECRRQNRELHRQLTRVATAS